MTRTVTVRICMGSNYFRMEAHCTATSRFLLHHEARENHQTQSVTSSQSDPGGEHCICAHWDNGAPVRNLVSQLDEQGVQPKTLISCEYKKALNKDSHSNPRFKSDNNEYYFYPKQAAKKIAE